MPAIFCVIRLKKSTYMGNDYVGNEQNALKQVLGESFDYFFLPESDLEITLKSIEDTEETILISNSNCRPEDIPPSLAKSLQEKTTLLIHPNSGFDNLPEILKIYQFKRAKLIKGNEVRKIPVAEYILGCLSHAFSVPDFKSKWSEKRNWDRKLVADQNILLVGFGHIGKYLAPILKLMARELEIYDPHTEIDPNYKTQQSFNPQDADVIILAPSLTDSSTGLINASSLNKMKNDIVIINPSRGQVIKETELISFLQANKSAKAYIDVYENEPNDLKAFSGLENVYLTSHIAGVYKNLDQGMINYIAKIVHTYKNNQSLEDYIIKELDQ